VQKTATADVSLPFCKKRIEEGKGVEGGSSATQKAVKTGVNETAPGDDQARSPRRVELTTTPHARYREKAAD
jgi:hypothetical protein